MRCQRCGFEIPSGIIDCPQCEKPQFVKNSSLPSSVSYFICVVVNTIGLILTMLVFKQVSIPFQVFVIAGLVIVYLTIKGTAGMNTLSLTEFAKLSYAKLRHDGTASANPQTDADSDYMSAQHTRAKIKMYINGAFDAALYAVALFNLIAALYQK